MDNALLISLTAQNALRRQMEIAANNMANVSTAGYKSETLIFEPVVRRPAAIVEPQGDINFVRDVTISRDFRPGALNRTDNPLDVALAGEGFFTIQNQGGRAYSRDGRFAVNPAGELVTNNGNQVLDDAGNPITLDLTRGDITVGADGTITQNGATIAKFGIATFQRPGTLDSIGDNLLVATSEQPTQLATPQLVQGMVEGSNVVAMRELTQILEISRAYESASRLQRTTEDLRKTAIERLARVQS